VSDFLWIYQTLRDIGNTPNAWIPMVMIYGTYLAVGVGVAKVAFFLGCAAGVVALALSGMYLFNLSVESGGIRALFGIPSAWVAWGTLVTVTIKYQR
jgi:hypothetical protein